MGNDRGQEGNAVLDKVPMRRVLVLGGAGSGKSRVSCAIGDVLRIKVWHLDAVIFTKGWRKASVVEFEEWLEGILHETRWIIDGNAYMNGKGIPALEKRLRAADTVIYLDLHPVWCVVNLIRRWCQGVGKHRLDLAPGCHERLTLRFLRVAWKFNSTRGRVIKGLVASRVPAASIVILKGRRQVEEFLDVFATTLGDR